MDFWDSCGKINTIAAGFLKEGRKRSLLGVSNNLCKSSQIIRHIHFCIRDNEFDNTVIMVRIGKSIFGGFRLKKELKRV